MGGNGGPFKIKPCPTNVYLIPWHEVLFNNAPCLRQVCVATRISGRTEEMRWRLQPASPRGLLGSASSIDLDIGSTDSGRPGALNGNRRHVRPGSKLWDMIDGGRLGPRNPFCDFFDPVPILHQECSCA